MSCRQTTFRITLITSIISEAVEVHLVVLHSMVFERRQHNLYSAENVDTCTLVVPIMVVYNTLW